MKERSAGTLRSKSKKSVLVKRSMSSRSTKSCCDGCVGAMLAIVMVFRVETAVLCALVGGKEEKVVGIRGEETDASTGGRAAAGRRTRG